MYSNISNYLNKASSLIWRPERNYSNPVIHKNINGQIGVLGTGIGNFAEITSYVQIKK